MRDFKVGRSQQSLKRDVDLGNIELADRLLQFGIGVATDFFVEQVSVAVEKISASFHGQGRDKLPQIGKSMSQNDLGPGISRKPHGLIQCRFGTR